MKLLLMAGVLSTAIALPVPFGHSGGSSSEERFYFYPSPGLPGFPGPPGPPGLPGLPAPPFFPQIPFPLPPQQPPILIPFPFPYDPNQGLTPNDFIQLLISILNQLGGLIGMVLDT
ncbi:secretory calcium-binding phosphoprotein proline-glutamine rich 1 [Erinaceus europaeus]|uniref:Secretory calcium-binding phosphoprotein proline-glutamine rich 1 n=1 Tax=Erinaceus europaeus TaxID=9365 RepID=A0ABM3X6I8_ERIEU|nr:secretory calcium-binding phosphoprotein proline-glutamine rich 1 [Erinaceus europaeus]